MIFKPALSKKSAVSQMFWGAQGGFSSIQDNVIAFRPLMTAAASNGRD